MLELLLEESILKESVLKESDETTVTFWLFSDPKTRVLTTSSEFLHPTTPEGLVSKALLRQLLTCKLELTN